MDVELAAIQANKRQGLPSFTNNVGTRVFVYTNRNNRSPAVNKVGALKASQHRPTSGGNIIHCFQKGKEFPIAMKVVLVLVVITKALFIRNRS